MNVSTFSYILLAVMFVGGCLIGQVILRCHLKLLESLDPTPEQILGRMSIEPAENFSLGSTTLAGSGSDDHHRPECIICISEILEGKEIKVLSRCKHGFHARCIERWLLLDHTSCPTCRTSCKKNTPAECSSQQQQLNDVVNDIEAAIPSETEMASTSTATPTK